MTARAIVGSLVAALFLMFVSPRIASVSASVNAPCDNLQLGDNTWVAKDSVVPTGGPWVESATSQIWARDNLLCTYNPFFVAPEQSASSAWIAIEGPVQSGLLGGGSIVQVGYIKCQHSDGCDFSGIPSAHFNQVVYFYAFGNAGDVFHLPSPQYIDVAGTGYHTFLVKLHYLSGGGRQWEFSVDGTIRAIIDDAWRTWNRTTIQSANELWNEGDQLGGTAAHVQDFRAISWWNGTNHIGLTGSPHLVQGHCYLWAAWSVTSSAQYSTWTTDPHTNC